MVYSFYHAFHVTAIKFLKFTVSGVVTYIRAPVQVSQYLFIKPVILSQFLN